MNNMAKNRQTSRPTPIRSNPSPSGDAYFENESNRAELKERVERYKKNSSKDSVVLRSSEEIANFFKEL